MLTAACMRRSSSRRRQSIPRSPTTIWLRACSRIASSTPRASRFRAGLSEPDEPPIAVRDLTGALQAWIDIGWPDAARLHKAAKPAPRVVVYMHKDPALFLRSLAGERIHRVEALELYALDRELVARWSRAWRGASHSRSRSPTATSI